MREPKMAIKGNILVIDDHANMLGMMRSLLEDEYDVETARSGVEGMEMFRSNPRDIVVSDIRMPEMGGMEVLEQVKEQHPETEVILMTAYSDARQAVGALKAGAYDYIIKPFDPDEMRLTVAKALERRRLVKRTEELQAEVEGRFGFENIVGESKAMRRAFELARKAMQGDATVLLTGESGTGKEVFARAIHYGSQRARKRFVTINCAAMPKELIESELFGHVKGAFSGALKEKSGLFEEADGGTLLLDEVTELAPDVQAKMNRVLQEGEVRRVGDTQDRHVDVRVVASTNRDLREAMSSGEFRDDLYFRLNVFRIHLPPLRDRGGDIPLLVDHFLHEFAGEDTDEYVIEPEARKKLLSYTWPGNVRELRNWIQRAVVLCEGKRLTGDLFDFPAEAGEPARQEQELSVPLDVPYRDAMDRMTKKCQTEYVLGTLKLCGGNVTRAAEHAGIERESFHRLMRKCDIKTDEVKRELAEEAAD
ncbi:MAG: response regulator [Armatimonadia bacterium]|nr:response regulator [Armatimonadia bacterium]